MWLRSALPLAAVALAAAATLRGQSAGAPQNSPEGLPPGAMQAKATTACTECHEARIILQQRLGKPAWTREVDKMMKWGALVEPNDREALIDYLNANFGVDRPPYQPPRLAAAKEPTQRDKK